MVVMVVVTVSYIGTQFRPIMTWSDLVPPFLGTHLGTLYASKLYVLVVFYAVPYCS